MRVPPVPVRGVLFDVDDTLVDTRAAFAAALGAVAARFLPDVPIERHPDVLAVWRRDDGGHFRAYVRGETDFHGQRRARANALHAVFGGPVLDGAAYAEWSDVFEATIHASWRPFDDVPGAVGRVAARGLRFGAVTNNDVAYQQRKLTGAGLGRVRLLVGLDTLGVGKPDARVFEEACRRLGTEPAETVFVGDELDVDAVGAARAGLVGVWLDRPASRRGGGFVEDEGLARAAGVRVVQSLDEIVGIL